jgi:predicted HTH domain antitoxin
MCQESDPIYATTTVTLEKLARVLGVPPGKLIEELPDEIEKRDKRI